MKKLILSLLLISNVSLAETVTNVRVLDMKQGPESVELKLQSKEGRPNSYFFVNIVKSDAGSFEKLSHVLNKMAFKDNYRLDLDIISFSDTPNGSYYQSDRVRFLGSAEREPNSVTKPKKTKKPNN
ncbi:MAG TPA: hypothetical protein VGE46_01500 [Bdellovibrio sp.]